jgi:hypothetical protein
VELTMTPDPLPAVLDQLAATLERLSDLDARETTHHAELHGQVEQLAGMTTAISRAFAEDTAALARLAALDEQVTELSRRLPGTASDDDEGYRPRPAPAWWKLAPPERQVQVAELADWTERVYRPGYGHLAAALAPCWPEHDLCLYALDIASQLWCALYLQPQRSTSLLSAQAEYQARILPALAAQLAIETTRCGHHPATAYGSTP